MVSQTTFMMLPLTIVLVICIEATNAFLSSSSSPPKSFVSWSQQQQQKTSPSSSTLQNIKRSNVHPITSLSSSSNSITTNSRHHPSSSSSLPQKEWQSILRDIDQIIFSSSPQKTTIWNQFKKEALTKVDVEHANDLQACASLAKEDISQNTPNTIHYQWIYPSITENKQQQQPLALQTLHPTPLLHPNDAEVIRTAASHAWNHPNMDEKTATSRFTYQRKGNYEIHLTDLIAAQPTIGTMMNTTLQKMIYPMVRHAFFGQEEEEKQQLCIYDALIIRYNATEASSFGNVGAGQPLHRDKSIISVNIMLNSKEEFDGGGTFFENQLISTSGEIIKSLKPMGVGHAVAHSSSERHAGAGTVSGVRDILVLFVTARQQQNDIVGLVPSMVPSLPTSETIVQPSHKAAAPIMERVARLKSNARSNCHDYCNTSNNNNIHTKNNHPTCNEATCRAIHHKTAIELNPNDGEAWHYLGMALGDSYNPKEEENGGGRIVLELALDCLYHATTLTPCDARLYNNIGLLLEKIASSFSGENQHHLYMEKINIHQAYQTSIKLHQSYQTYGKCADVTHDYDGTCLNYALFLSYQDDFEGAVQILSNLFPSNNDGDNGVGEGGGYDSSSSDAGTRIREDAFRLFMFCQQQVDLASL